MLEMLNELAKLVLPRIADLVTDGVVGNRGGGGGCGGVPRLLEGISNRNPSSTGPLVLLEVDVPGRAPSHLNEAPPRIVIHRLRLAVVP